ncbi:MAG TPA: FtsQ-type POTRA domain-containing protein [Candidatus Aminicenantes bacterium]|nr:FtsQ-type POTRA domain-containing protein [Candidatus Aminicenantes bacterium]
MAVRYDILPHSRSGYLHPARPLADRKRKIRQLPRRKIRVTPLHTLGAFLLFCGIFFGFQQLYLFLITWEKLNVSTVEIACPDENLKEKINQLLAGRKLGNILICDLNPWREKIQALPWAKNVVLRKSLPSTLLIRVEPRQPAAVLVRDGHGWLIDREGTLLETTSPAAHPELPLIIDSTPSDSPASLQLAWQLLEEVDDSLRKDLAWIKISIPQGITIAFQGDETPLILGFSHFKQKLAFYHQTQAVLDQYRPLEYIDLRLEDRVYFKPKRPAALSSLASTAGEENHG